MDDVKIARQLGMLFRRNDGPCDDERDRWFSTGVSAVLPSPQICADTHVLRNNGEWYHCAGRCPDVWTRVGRLGRGRQDVQRLLSIQGSIGVGKSTVFKMLRERLANRPEVAFAPEPVDLWQKAGCLEAMYSKRLDKDTFQFMTFTTRFAALMKAFLQPGVRLVISERDMEADQHVFALPFCTIEHHQAYKAMTESTRTCLPMIARRGMVLLSANANTLLDRIETRSRPEEAGVDLAYLKKLEEGHTKLMKHTKADTMMEIDTDDMKPEAITARIMEFVEAALMDAEEDDMIYKRLHTGQSEDKEFTESSTDDTTKKRARN